MSYAVIDKGNAHEGSVTLNTLGSDLIAVITTDILVDYVVPTDDQSNSFGPGALTGVSNGIVFDRMFILYAPNTSASHQFTVTGGGFNTASMNVIALSGAASSFLDDQDYNNDSNPFPSTSKAAPTSTPTQDNDIVIQCTSFRFAAASPVSIDSSYTKETEYGGGNHCLALAQLIQTTASASTPTWTYQINDSGYGCFTAVALKAAGGATTTAIHQLVNAGIVNRGLVNNGLVN